MAGNYGPFVKGTVVTSTATCIILIIAAVIANPLGGMIMAAFLIVVLALFLKALTFAFEPQNLPTYSARANQPPKDMSPEEWVTRYVNHFDDLPTKTPEASNRILGGSSNRDLVVTARIIGASALPVNVLDSWQQESTNKSEEKRKEDTEWADMFRAL